MGNFLKSVVIVTVMALLYIHLQMNIYALAYQGKKKEVFIEKLAERNDAVKHDILRLTSSDHIGRSMLSKDQPYQFAGGKNVLEVEAGGHAPEVAAQKAEEQGFFSRVMTLAFRDR